MIESQGVLDFMVTREMSDAEIAVWQILRNHRGAENAIKADLVAELAGLNVRNVQRGVHGLIHDHAKPIGSSMRDPFGYFLAVTPEERAAAAEMLRARGIAMLTTAARILAIDRRELLREIQLEIEAA